MTIERTQIHFLSDISAAIAIVLTHMYMYDKEKKWW